MSYKLIVKDVLTNLRRIGSLRSLHLTSIAKAIEQEAQETIKVIFRPVPPDKLGKFPTVLLTQQLEATGAGAPNGFTIFEHFVFYPQESPDQLLKTRFSIAHELGHILMHAPYLPRYIKRRKYDKIEGTNGGLYSVAYNDEDEIRADLFAAILCHQYPPPPKPSEFHAPCRRILAQLESDNFFSSSLPRKISKIKACNAFQA